MTLLAPEFRDGAVREWHATADGVDAVRNESYTPSFYVDAPEPIRAELAAALARDPKVVDTAAAERYLDLRRDARESVLRVDLERVGEIRTLAHEVLAEYTAEYAPGAVRLYDVDLAPGFRYCVDTDTSPMPDRDLRRLDLSIPERALVDGDLSALRVDGEQVADAGRRKGQRVADRDVLEAVRTRLRTTDPDVLVVSTADLIPLCSDRAAELGLDDFRLGRAPGYERLAGQSTYHSYGRVGHSPARYGLPGRAIIDRSNSFLLSKAGLPGLLDLVERSRRPIQETARGSIGTILTSIEIRRARERGVLAPWNKWEPEAFKPVRTLHAADRGGFTFAPEPGLYEDVVEVDFGSLYPNVMREYNVSPETVDCACHDRADVPELGYSLCDRDGFLAAVLGPLIDDRAAFKEELAALRERCDDAGGRRDYQARFVRPADGAADDASGAGEDGGVADRVATLEGRIDALKWVLVSCFGYQGYRNAKFGRIECHEAINAIARDLILDAKERLEANGWEVVHGIVDSLWIRARDPDPTPIGAVADAVSADADVPLEVEDRFDWVAFAPLRDSRAGALTRYFGKIAGADGGDDGSYRVRGIEARQRSTCSFVADVQRDLIRTFDRTRDPEVVCDRLRRALGRLDSQEVDPSDLAVRQRVSKSLSAYDRRTRAVAALERARDHGLSRAPGQDIRYVVVDDDRRDSGRVRLPFESVDRYDEECYRERLLRAAASVLSPVGWERGDIERYLRDETVLTLTAFE